MKTDFLEISKAYRDYLQNRDPGTCEPCPDIELIITSFLTGVPKKDKARIVSHAASCVKCSQLLKKFLAYSSEIDRFVEREQAIYEKMYREISEKRSLWARLPKNRPVFITAMLLCIAIITIIIIRPNVPLSTRDVVANTQINQVSPVNGNILIDKIQFRWEKVAVAKYYIIEIFDVSLNLIWRSDPIIGNSVDFSSGNQKLAQGGIYYWMVTAVMEDDTKSKSKLKEFSIAK